MSTDDLEIAAVARQYGADVPFLRPTEIAGDASTDLEAFEHALGWLRQNEHYVPDICVHLRPTYPLRHVEEIERVVSILIETPGLDSVRSVASVSETPFKMWFRDGDGLLTPAVSSATPDAYNLPRQLLPQAYLQNAAIDAVWTRVITELRSMTGRVVYGYVMNANFDIDDDADLQRVAEFLEQEEPQRS